MIHCPPAYDWNKTNYIVGQRVEIKSFIFECSEELYCNTPYPDMLQTDEEIDLWNTAWSAVHACFTTETPPSSSSTPMPTREPTLDPLEAPSG